MIPLLRLEVDCDATALTAALDSLSAKLPDLPLEIVQRFLDSGTELCSVHSEGFVAGGANKLLILLQPSDLLVEFLAAVGAGD
nr:hypothetical protein [Nitrosospira briensis]